MTTLLLINPAAGGGKGKKAESVVLAAARRAWGDVEIVRTGKAGDAVEVGREAADQGIERIIVVGGDGTVHEVANGMLATGIAALPRLGVVPIGTGNDFARLTGTASLAPVEAVRRLAAGNDQLFDAGLAWGEYFVNSLGLGFDATVAAQVPRFRRLWRPLVYPAAVLRSFMSYRAFQVVAHGDDDHYSGGIFCIEVGIGQSTGGGFFLTPDALANDGLFDVCVIVPISFREFITLTPRAFRGTHTGLKQVRMMRTSSLTIRGSQPLQVHFDGEVRTGPETIEIRIIENRLPVLTVRGDK
jgi:diacylglycerol kinase (ATP)